MALARRSHASTRLTVNAIPPFLRQRRGVFDVIRIIYERVTVFHMEVRILSLGYSKLVPYPLMRDVLQVAPTTVIGCCDVSQSVLNDLGIQISIKQAK